MSFSSEIKTKLAKNDGLCKNCDLFELAGFLGNSAKITKDSITLVTENNDVANKIKKIINNRYSENLSVTFNSNIYKIIIIDHELALKILNDTAYLDEKINIEDECCIGSYIRGAFLGGGSINNPQKSYHLEFDYKYPQQAEKIKNTLERTGLGVKTAERKGHIVVYLKEYEAIAGILGIIGAGGAAMEIYNVSAEKEIRNEINRQMNCENANMDKIASAYCKHMQAIEKINSKMGLDKLPESLKEAAEIRMKFPEEGLKDLGGKFKPPIGKSGVNHRLNRLIEIAESL